MVKNLLVVFVLAALTGPAMAQSPRMAFDLCALGALKDGASTAAAVKATCSDEYDAYLQSIAEGERASAQAELDESIEIAVTNNQ
jgi:hypothetical protein